jgi:hypothetical protein
MTHRSTLFHSIVKRSWLLAFLVLVLALTGIVVFERALAEPPELKPPFKIVRDDARPFGLNGPEALPLNGAIIFSQTFNSSYVPVPLNQKGWHEVSVIPNQYTWARITGVPLTDTVWSAALNPAGKPPLTETYTNGMEAMLIYGPFSLSEYHQAVLTATYWLDTKPGDFLGLAYSTDGSNWVEPFYTGGTDPSLAEPQTAIANLSTLSGKPVVWIAFVFTSNNDNLNGRGAYLKDVVVRGTPYSRYFLPLVRRDATPTPTPTPTATPAPNYRYFYTFTDESPTNNPDFNRWGGDRSTNVSCGTNGTNTCTYYQSLAKGLGNPGNALTLWIQGTNGKGGAGPRQSGVSLSTATNFEYSADLYVYQGQRDAIYGLVFDASSGTFPDSGNPPINTSVNYYLFQLHMDTTTASKVATWQVVKVTNGDRNNLKSSTIPISLNQGQWHNVKVRQSGSTMEFYLNGQSLGTATYNHDGTWNNDRRRFGLYIDVRSSNSGTTPFEYFSDNIAVRDLP